MKRKIRKTLSLLLAFALLLHVSGADIAAAGLEGVNEEIKNEEIVNQETVNEEAINEEDISAEAGGIAITGDNSVGGLVADVLSEEQARTESGVNISGLTFNGAEAAVTYNAETIAGECDLVVAVYAETAEPLQMLASGTKSVPGGG